MPKSRPAPPRVGDAASRRLRDPRSIRALAHPARLAIINALATGEELTATQCAELTGLSPSATAYHLNFLEQHGFAEPAPPRPDGREKPWRSTTRKVEFDLDSSTPAGASAAAAVVAAYIDATRSLAIQFTEGEHHEPAAWRNAALENVDLWLTAEELRQVAEGIDTLLQPYRGRGQAGERPSGSRRVRVMNVVVPHPRAEPASPSGRA